MLRYKSFLFGRRQENESPGGPFPSHFQLVQTCCSPFLIGRGNRARRWAQAAQRGLENTVTWLTKAGRGPKPASQTGMSGKAPQLLVCVWYSWEKSTPVAISAPSGQFSISWGRAQGPALVCSTNICWLKAPPTIYSYTWVCVILLN